MTRTSQQQVTHLLSDLYSVEVQALAQLESAPKVAGSERLAASYTRHLEETRSQAERIQARLEACGGSPSAAKDAIMKAGGKGFLAFARMQSESPGRLHAHAYSYEAMEWAGYGMLAELAQLADDPETAEIAKTIQSEERVMMERLEAVHGEVENLAHADLSQEKVASHVGKHLAEVHAFEKQSIQFLERASSTTQDPALVALYEAHLEETKAQTTALEERLQARGEKPSKMEDLAMKMGGFEWGLFFAAQKDSAAKLAAFGYAFEHLEIASYELLGRTARRAGDLETAQLCERILGEEQAMTRRLSEHFGRAAEETLSALQ